MAALGFHRELAQLDPAPADQLARGPRTLARNVDPDVGRHEAGRGGNEDRVANGGFFAPRDPAFRVQLGSQRPEDGIDGGSDLR